MTARFIPKEDVSALIEALETGHVVHAKPGLAGHYVARPLGGEGLTCKARETLEFIAAHIRRHGLSPSYGEIMRGLGIASKSEVYRRIRMLEARGCIARRPGCARSLRILVAADAVPKSDMPRRDA